jgi:NAD(P)-dependent dehydrogenase (short-subunit alcohol dehydrogenase family)
MSRLEGKVAVITGGASGIGAATARRFVAEGARVVIADLQGEVAHALAGELGAAAAVAVECNVIREDDVAGALQAALDRFGRLDIVFNNAGFGGASGSLEETSADEYDMTMNVLLRGVFFGIKHATPLLRAQGGGSIINTASICAFEAGVGAHIYSVAKAAVVMLTKTAALELAESNIRVNAVCPGYIATPLAAGRPISTAGAERSAAAVGRLREANAARQPLQRSGEGDDIASMALFLASDDAAWVTGQAMVVDGGFLAGRPWRDWEPWRKEHREITLYRP